MRKELPKQYDPTQVESQIYQMWLDRRIVCFADDERLLKKAFTNPDFLFIIKE